MKQFLILLLTVTILFQGCRTNQPDIVKFSSSTDTLLIRTQKQRGSGLFSLGVSSCHFKNITDSFPYPIIYPEDIDGLERMQMGTDFWAEEMTYIDVIKGQIGDSSVFVIDENNNKDLTDDSVRHFRPINWKSKDNLIKLKYTVTKDGQEFEDSSWLRIGTLNGDLWNGRSEHLIADFYIDDDFFRIGIVTPRGGDFTYKLLPEVALLTHNSSFKDSLMVKDILQKGEFLKLKDTYYRFDSLSYFGKWLQLVKVNDFDQMVGTQVGMIAPEFTCVTVAGDTLNSNNLHNRIIILANSCGCGGDKESTQVYYDILEEYGDNIHIIHIDSRIASGESGFQVETENEFNKDIYNNYRQAYCSRTIYVIDTNNRILDKFQSWDWELYLPQLLNR